MSQHIGPQCLTCKRRQVKCDSREPLCQRCEKDGRECRGYKHDLKIVAYRPKNRNPGATKRDNQEHTPLSSRLSHKSAEVRNARPRLSPDDSELPTLQHSIPPDQDYVALLESFRYYEDHVLPYTLPPRLPFHRTKIDRTVPWHVLPKLLVHCMILSLRSMRVSIYSPDPTTRADLCHYRGLGLSGVFKALPDAVSDPHGLALGCVLLLMGTDLLISPAGSWTAHFEAARRIIYLKGGMGKCLAELPGSRNLLVIFLVTDILSGTTCPANELRSKFCMLPEYRSLISGTAPDLLRQGFLCPPRLLDAISQITAMRTGNVELNSLERIRDILTAFDASEWATNVLSNAENVPPHDPDTTLVVSSLGGCYQSATSIYLELTCVDHPSEAEVACAKERLDHHIGIVFNFADTDMGGPLHGQLWKFLQWPLFVSAYATIGWGLANDVEVGDPFVALDQIERIKATGIANGSVRQVMAAQLLHEISLQRSRQRSWKWDDGFPARCSFGL